jgi:hypothetical protein
MAKNFQELYCLWPKPIEFITFSALDTVFAVLFKSTVAPHHQLEPHLETLKSLLNIIFFNDLLAVLCCSWCCDNETGMKPNRQITERCRREQRCAIQNYLIACHYIPARNRVLITVSAQNKNYLSPTIDMVLNSQNGRYHKLGMTLMSIFCFAIVNRHLDPHSSEMKKSSFDKKEQLLLVLNFFHEDAKKKHLVLSAIFFLIRPQTRCVKTKRYEI